MSLFNLKSNYTFQQKKLALNVPIYEVFKRIYTRYEQVFFLESLGELGDFSRYSMIGFSPYTHVVAQKNTLVVDGQAHPVENPFFALREIKQVQLPQSTFCGGLVGYLSYEGTRYFEPVAQFKPSTLFPDFEFGLYLDGIVYDKKTKDFYYFYLSDDRSEEIIAAVARPPSLQPFSFKDLGADTSAVQHARMVKYCLEQIKAGVCFQIVPAVQFAYELTGSPLFLYEQLREVNPSPHMYFLKFGERHIMGASPELIVRYQVDHTGLIGNRVENFPLAGTTRRGVTAQEDTKLAQAMLANTKEQAEHMMLVDLGRNDLGRVSKFGSVTVSQFMQVKKYSHVQHIASEIEGEVCEDKDAFDCLYATFPMGTVTGAPKVEAMKIINHLEQSPRGPYAGGIGYFSFNGDGMFCVGLRSLAIAGNRAYAGAGSGIVYDSEATHEYQEVIRKSAGMRRALEQAQERSKQRTKKSYTLEELRIHLDECGQKILLTLREIQNEKNITSLSTIAVQKTTIREKKQWVAHLFHALSGGLDVDTIKKHFQHVTAKSPEVERLYSGQHFKHTTVMQTGDFPLDDRKFSILHALFDTRSHALLEVLQERFYWIQYVSYFKKDRHIAVRKREREQTILRQTIKQCQALGLAPELARLLYLYVIFPISFEIEEMIIGKK